MKIQQIIKEHMSIISLTDEKTIPLPKELEKYRQEISDIITNEELKLLQHLLDIINSENNKNKQEKSWWKYYYEES